LVQNPDEPTELLEHREAMNSEEATLEGSAALNVGGNNSSPPEPPEAQTPNQQHINGAFQSKSGENL